MKKAQLAWIGALCVLVLALSGVALAGDGVAEDYVTPDTVPANPLWLYLLAGLIGAATVGVPGFIALCLLLDRAYWMGFRDYEKRLHLGCQGDCECCRAYTTCLNPRSNRPGSKPGRGE